MTWWNKIPEMHKVLAAVFALVVTLFMSGLALADFVGLPEKVETVEQRVQRLEAGQEKIMRGIDRTNCYLDNLVENQPQRRCP